MSEGNYLRFTPLGDRIRIFRGSENHWNLNIEFGENGGYNFMSYPTFREAMTVAERFRNKRIRQYEGAPIIRADRDTEDYLNRIGVA